jgi:exonuclease VII small subunit
MQKNSPSIQDKIESLDQLVAWFNGDDFQLEQAAIKLKEAAKLVSEIEADLQSVANEVKIVKQSFSESNS